MWYIFPQIKDLGRSGASEFYGITGLDEAKAYLANDILGSRLIEISSTLLELETDDAVLILGKPDNLKLKSSMTLFSCAAPDIPVFCAIIEKFFHGKHCQRTLSILDMQNA